MVNNIYERIIEKLSLAYNINSKSKLFWNITNKNIYNELALFFEYVRPNYIATLDITNSVDDNEKYTLLGDKSEKYNSKLIKAFHGIAKTSVYDRILFPFIFGMFEIEDYEILSGMNKHNLVFYIANGKLRINPKVFEFKTIDGFLVDQWLEIYIIQNKLIKLEDSWISEYLSNHVFSQYVYWLFQDNKITLEDSVLLTEKNKRSQIADNKNSKVSFELEYRKQQQILLFEKPIFNEINFDDDFNSISEINMLKIDAEKAKYEFKLRKQNSVQNDYVGFIGEKIIYFFLKNDPTFLLKADKNEGTKAEIISNPEKFEWSRITNNSLPYDFSIPNENKYIEVKSTLQKSSNKSFIISWNEYSHFVAYKNSSLLLRVICPPYEERGNMLDTDFDESFIGYANKANIQAFDYDELFNENSDRNKFKIKSKDLWVVPK